MTIYLLSALPSSGICRRYSVISWRGCGDSCRWTGRLPDHSKNRIIAHRHRLASVVRLDSRRHLHRRNGLAEMPTGWLNYYCSCTSRYLAACDRSSSLASTRVCPYRAAQSCAITAYKKKDGSSLLVWRMCEHRPAPSCRVFQTVKDTVHDIATRCSCFVRDNQLAQQLCSNC